MITSVVASDLIKCDLVQANQELPTYSNLAENLWLSTEYFQGDFCHNEMLFCVFFFQRISVENFAFDKYCYDERKTYKIRLHCAI